MLTVPSGPSWATPGGSPPEGDPVFSYVDRSFYAREEWFGV